MANETTESPLLRRRVRQATRGDAAAIHQLLRMGTFSHVHVDWRLPGEWLGQPGFVVCMLENGGENGRGRKGATPNLAGCLAVAADPPPTAWVRVAAATSTADFDRMQAMFAHILAVLDLSIDEIAWFLTDYWPLDWLERLGFTQVSEVLAFRKDDLETPPYDAPPGLEVRPLLMEDLPALEEIERAAFEPRWRHSAENLYRAWRQAIGFDIALMDGTPVAFQFSTGGEGIAHLSRMTVHPDRQGLGIGAALLAVALKSYRRQKVRAVTLNTQADNLASRRLYERFGFRPTGDSYPVWSYYPARNRRE